MTKISAPGPNKFNDRHEWRAWLEKNHVNGTVAWLLIRKKLSPGPGIFYDEAVEEAVCFGFIDGQMRSIDANSYMLRFSPRKPRSIWSKINRDRAEVLMKQGKMAPSGLQKVEEAKKNGMWDVAYSSKEEAVMPADLAAVLAKDIPAKETFDNFSNSAKFQYIYWINQAKTQGTREKRIQETVRRAHQGMKPGEK